MITRDINDLAQDLTNELIDAIFRIAKEKQENEIELNFKFHNELIKVMEVYFPDDDDISDEEYLNEMNIEVITEYTDDEDGLSYENTDDLYSLDLSVLLAIYNNIK